MSQDDKKQKEDSHETPGAEIMSRGKKTTLTCLLSCLKCLLMFLLMWFSVLALVLYELENIQRITHPLAMYSNVF